jgi:sRNA-binding protein
MSTNPRSVLKQFADTYPAIKRSLPLVIGIDKQLVLLHSELSPKVIKSALFHYTKTATYIRNVAKSAHRYGLDGVAAGEISAEQRSFAQQQLKTMNENRAKAKQAEEQLKIDALKIKKLEELVAKFGKN